MHLLSHSVFATRVQFFFTAFPSGQTLHLRHWNVPLLFEYVLPKSHWTQRTEVLYFTVLPQRTDGWNPSGHSRHSRHLYFPFDFHVIWSWLHAFCALTLHHNNASPTITWNTLRNLAKSFNIVAKKNNTKIYTTNGETLSISEDFPAFRNNKRKNSQKNGLRSK